MSNPDRIQCLLENISKMLAEISSLVAEGIANTSSSNFKYTEDMLISIYDKEPGLIIKDIIRLASKNGMNNVSYESLDECIKNNLPEVIHCSVGDSRKPGNKALRDTIATQILSNTWRNDFPFVHYIRRGCETVRNSEQ